MLFAIIFGWYVTYTARGIGIIYDQADTLSVQTQSLYERSIEIGDRTVYLPSFNAYSPVSPWLYVTASRPLPTDYKPTALVELNVDATNDADARAVLVVATQLSKMFQTADDDGYDLAISSAYRSIENQQKLFDEMKRARGESVARQFVLDPGASEHHTGYAVDLTDYSNACIKDSDECILSPATATWIENNAHLYGFIVRYPSGKESITGIAHEPWHVRYVGVALARALYESDTTFDEFIQSVAPGRS